MSCLAKREKGVGESNLLGVVPKAPPTDSSWGLSEPGMANEREDVSLGVSLVLRLVVAGSSLVCGRTRDITPTLERMVNASLLLTLLGIPCFALGSLSFLLLVLEVMCVKSFSLRYSNSNSFH